MSSLQMFRPSHKALRWVFSQALTRLGTSPGDPVAVDAALGAVRELLAACELHKRVEDAVVYPAIEARRPGAIMRLMLDHAEQGDVIEALRARLDAASAGDATEESLHALYLELSRFVGDNLLHMYDEETLAQPLLEEIFSPAELVALHQRLLASLTEEERAGFTALMLPSLSFAERAAIPVGS